MVLVVVLEPSGELAERGDRIRQGIDANTNGPAISPTALVGWDSVAQVRRPAIGQASRAEKSEDHGKTHQFPRRPAHWSSRKISSMPIGSLGSQGS